MAYLAFDEIGTIQQQARLVPSIPAEEPHHERRARFSALEWSVIAIAARDRISSLAEPGRLSVALGNLFGKRPNKRLADPKLEALRRMAVLSWHHSFTVPAREIKAFLAAGFTVDQYETMLESISAANISRKRR